MMDTIWRGAEFPINPTRSWAERHRRQDKSPWMSHSWFGHLCTGDIHSELLLYSFNQHISNLAFFKKSLFLFLLKVSHWIYLPFKTESSSKKYLPVKSSEIKLVYVMFVTKSVSVLLSPFISWLLWNFPAALIGLFWQEAECHTKPRDLLQKFYCLV